MHGGPDYLETVSDPICGHISEMWGRVGRMSKYMTQNKKYHASC